MAFRCSGVRVNSAFNRLIAVRYLALMSSCAYIHVHVSCHKELVIPYDIRSYYTLNSSFKPILIIIIIIIIDVKNKKLLHSITVTAKSSKKMKGGK